MSHRVPPQVPPCADPDTIGASIGFCPASGEMTIRFVGGRCEGLPPWSLELAAFAAGAPTVRIDLTDIDLVDAKKTTRVLGEVLRHEHGVEHVLFELAPAAELV